jgi:hypothetical protein
MDGILEENYDRNINHPLGLAIEENGMDEDVIDFTDLMPILDRIFILDDIGPVLENRHQWE